MIAEPVAVAPRAATAFRQDTAFGRDYYALKSHCIPTIASRLDLPNPQSRHRQDYYAVKSHFFSTIASRLDLPDPQSLHLQDYYAVKSHLAAARRIVEGCGNTCAALFWAVDAALEGEIALKGEVACVREATRAREDARIGEEGGGSASDGGGGTREAWARVPPLGASTLKTISARSVLTGRRARAGPVWTPRVGGGGALRPVSELCGKRDFCASWVLCGERPRRFPQGPKRFFAQHLLGSDGKSG